MFEVGGGWMQISMEQLVEQLPSYIQKNKKVLFDIEKVFDTFLKAPGKLIQQETNEMTNMILMKNNFQFGKPFQNTSYYYLEIAKVSGEQTEVYFGQTRKGIDENQCRYSIMNPVKYNCYLNEDNHLHVEVQSQKIIDQEAAEYRGFLFRNIHAERTNEMYSMNHELVKKEYYYGDYTQEIPFPHQAVEESYTTKPYFEIEIDCPFYQLMNSVEETLYIRTLFSKTEMEKFFVTKKTNVDESLQVIHENEMIPISKEDWDRAIESIMKLS